MSEDLSVHRKDTLKGSAITDEIMICDLVVPYATLFNSSGLTKIDMHIKMDEAKDLCEKLQEILKLQTQGEGRDKSLPQTKTATARIHAQESAEKPL